VALQCSLVLLQLSNLLGGQVVTSSSQSLEVTLLHLANSSVFIKLLIPTSLTRASKRRVHQAPHPKIPLATHPPSHRLNQASHLSILKSQGEAFPSERLFHLHQALHPNPSHHTSIHLLVVSVKPVISPSSGLKVTRFHPRHSSSVAFIDFIPKSPSQIIHLSSPPIPHAESAHSTSGFPITGC